MSDHRVKVMGQRMGRGLRRWWPLLLTGLVLAILVVGYGPFRQWRADRLIAEAETLWASEAWGEAWEKARAARQLAPQDRAIQAVAARLGESVDPALAARWWVEVEEAGETTEERQAALEGQIRAALRLGRGAELERLLARLVETFGPSSFARRQEARMHRLMERPVEAAAAAWQLLEAADRMESDAWFVIELALDSPQKADNDRARSLLQQWALERERPDFAHAALRRFCQLPKLSEGERDFAIRRWEDLARDREDRLLALELRLAQVWVDREAVASAARALFDLRDPAEQLRLGRWFNQGEMYREALGVISETDALRRNDLYLVRLDSLALLDQWEAVKALLSLGRVPLRPFMEEAFRMRSHLELGEDSRARLAWARALQAARGEPLSLRFLARYTQGIGRLDLTVDALWALVESAGFRRQGYYSLLAIYEEAKETESVFKVLTAMRADYPYDYAVLNDWAYYAFLVDAEVDEALRLTRELIGLNPDQLSHRMNLILAQLSVGNFAGALAYAESLPVPDWTQVKSQRWRSLIAICLLENGRKGEANLALRGVTTERLMPQELELLQIALQR